MRIQNILCKFYARLDRQMKNTMAGQIVLIALILCTAPSHTAFSQVEVKKDDTYKKAVKYFYQKKFEMAEVLFQESLKKDPENVLAYSYLGDILLSKKNYDGALNLYKKALDLKPDIAENYFRIGQIYYYKKLGNMAIENFQKALDVDNTLKFSHYHIGLTYLMIVRDKENTIRSWETYLRVAPEDPQYENIRRVIQLLKDPNFILPPPGSEVTIEEALLLGGAALTTAEHKASDKKAGNESKKTKKKVEGLYLDDEL